MAFAGHASCCYHYLAGLPCSVNNHKVDLLTLQTDAQQCFIHIDTGMHTYASLLLTVACMLCTKVLVKRSNIPLLSCSLLAMSIPCSSKQAVQIACCNARFKSTMTCPYIELTQAKSDPQRPAAMWQDILHLSQLMCLSLLVQLTLLTLS